jgi:hypothetical protein
MCMTLVLSLLLAVETDESGKANPRDARSAEVAEAWLAAILRQDAEAAMKTASVPFVFDGRGTIKDRDKLRSSLSRLFPQSRVNCKLHGTYQFDALPKSAFEDRIALEEVLGKTDHVVVFQLARRGIAVAVRSKEGTIVGVSVGPWLHWAAAAEESGNPDKRALRGREVAQKMALQFLKAATAKDLEGLLKVVDVPWYDDGTRVLKGREELEQFLKRRVVESTKDAPLPQVLGLVRVGRAGQLYGGERLRPDEAVTKEDWIALVGRDRQAFGFLLLRVRDDECKVVGTGQ